ncbi:MAG: DNA gyrase subunit A [Methanomassiliicoccales archaeon]|nr:MAG: DNA gyrase subunit A [Methanomassiliicoccales archaeon]
MKKCYIDYAMSVIVGRALPDVRDGLKPVHRRILYAMYDMGIASNKPHKKSARVVGDTLGRYHPHGDTAVYDSLVRMAQPFSLRYMLIDGQGNFGSVDGDSAAAMRYTECRLSKIAEEMLLDIDKETVNFVDNFDGSLKEPEVLPAKLPNLILNGASGIAVGMATNMPPHNLKETVDAIVHLIDHPDAEVIDLMQFIKGPDFPTGGILYGVGGILEAYQTGRGKLRVRARTEIEEHEGRTRIIVREIPYQVNKSKLIESIADLVKDKKVEGITDLRDESDRQGMRIVIELRKDIQPDIVLNHLFKQTQLESGFGVINLALVNNEPKVLTLKELLQNYIAHRHDVVVKRTRYELAQARKREHILIALIMAVDAIDETLAIIRGSGTPEEARNGLMTRFGIDEEQAKAILDMRLQKLTGLEIEELRNEFADLERTIADLLDILANESRVYGIIKTELQKLKEEFGDERRTEIVADARDLEDEDLIPNEDMVVMVTQDGYIKRVPLDTYKQQRRGGIGLMGMETKEEDFVTDMFVTLTHNFLLFFTNKGRVYSLKAYKLPVGSRQSKGKAIINLLPKLEDGEKVMVTMPVEKISAVERYLVFATKNGIIKKTPLEAYSNIRSSGIIAISLEQGDELVDVKITDGTKEIILATKEGQAARFEETQVRPMGRPAHGVIGIRMDDGDEVVSMAVVTPRSMLLTVTENGYGKITPVGKWEPTDEHDVYRKTNRGGKGVITIKTDERNGKVVSVMEVEDEDQLVVASKSGNVQRIIASEIRKTGRVAMGVRIMRLKEEGDKVIAVARLAGRKEEQKVVETESKGDRLLPDIPEEPGGRSDTGEDD